MPVTRARGGFQTQLQRGDGAGSETFTTVAEIKDISGPARTHATEEATNMDSPEGWAEHVALGIKEAGEVTCQMHFLQDDASQALLNADLVAGTKRNFRLILPGATKRWSFSAFVMSIGEEHPVRGVMVAPVTLKVTGKPVFEAHS